MKAVILAGGFGTRMRPLTFSRPKPLMHILNKPITQHILDQLKETNVTEVALTTNYLREQIQQYFGDEYRGIKIIYPEEKTPLGTAGCVKNIEGFFDDTFMVLQGDTITDINLTALIKQHKYFGGLGTIAAYRVDDPWNFGVMELQQDNRIKMFHEKPKIGNCVSNLVNTGIYVLEPEIFNFIPPNKFWDFSKDLFPILVERQSLFASEQEGFWVDIGRPIGYEKAKKHLMSKLKTKISDTSEIVGKVEGPVVVGENVMIGKHSHIIGPVLIGDDVVLERGVVVGPNTTISNNVYVKGETMLHGTVLFENSIVGSGQDISKSIIGEACVIGERGHIQSDVLVGGDVHISPYVSIISGSRIWPHIALQKNSMVSGTLKRFIAQDIVYADPKWSLRTLTPEEAFYFNKFEGNHVFYTGQRAVSLVEFKDKLKKVEESSILHHLREDQNDFRQWFEKVIGDTVLSSAVEQIKKGYLRGEIKMLKYNVVKATEDEINRLIKEVRKPGYV